MLEATLKKSIKCNCMIRINRYSARCASSLLVLNQLDLSLVNCLTGFKISLVFSRIEFISHKFIKIFLGEAKWHYYWRISLENSFLTCHLISSTYIISYYCSSITTYIPADVDYSSNFEAFFLRVKLAALKLSCEKQISRSLIGFEWNTTSRRYIDGWIVVQSASIYLVWPFFDEISGRLLRILTRTCVKLIG